MGHGHLRRCLVLADAFGAHGLRSRFVMRRRSRASIPRIKGAGHDVTLLASHRPGVGDSALRGGGRRRWLSVPWLVDARQTLSAIDCRAVRCVIVDHYGLDGRWEGEVGRRTQAVVVVIDGLANRPHECHLVVDPTYSHPRSVRRWDGLVARDTPVLAGPRYALLRPEFSKAAVALPRRDGRVEHLLVAFGGSDPGGATELAVDALCRLGAPKLNTTVVAGADKSDLGALRRRMAGRSDMEIHVDTDEMARLMARADLAIGGAGTMMWERAFLRLPAIVVAVAPHQADVARPVAETGAVDYLGIVDHVRPTRLCQAVADLMSAPGRVQEMIQKNRDLIDDARQVGTKVVASRILNLIE